MVANDAAFDIIDDASLRDAVRGETGYSEDKLSVEDLNDLTNSAKRLLSLRADTTDFYEDRGTAVALLGVTAIKAKGRVENQPVQVKNLGIDDVTFRTTDGSSLQVAEYEDMVQLGLSNADNTDVGTTSIRFTNTHLSDSSSTNQYP